MPALVTFLSVNLEQSFTKDKYAKLKITNILYFCVYEVTYNKKKYIPFCTFYLSNYKLVEFKKKILILL